MKNLYLLGVLVVFSFLNSRAQTNFVNPFIGTGGHGHTYPGASVPFGMMQVSPDTRLNGWDGCSGYHYSDSVIYGFTHTHLSGTGCLDYGDILLMPTVGDAQFSNQNYSSKFKHINELAEAGHYLVLLEKNNILAELTASKRTAMHKYKFDKKDESGNVILDLFHRDIVLDSKINILNDSLVTGYRFSKSWARNQRVYFAVRFNKPIQKSLISENDNSISDKKSAAGKNLKAAFSFNLKGNSYLLLKIGISAVSEEGALANLDSEMPDWNFAGYQKIALNEWNKELSKIEIKGGTNEQKTAFYTALYHSMLNPNLYMDVDGRYRGRDDSIHKATKFDYYTVFSLWDTYRAEHPLFTIIDQKRTNDFINTFISQWEQGGLLPVWELSANETYCMIGYHAVPVIADALAKGIKNYDIKKALSASLTSANKDHFGLNLYKKYGFIPGDSEGESVSKTLEYAYDDWCIAQIAKVAGDKKTFNQFINRAQGYKNIYDKETGFMRARVNGGWYSPFNPTEVNNNYTEANSWQYSFYVPQDVSGLIKLTGGSENFEKKLDGLFHSSSEMTGRDQSDITGLIGQYAHGNEPSHHIAYLYNYCGKPWKTQAIVRKIMDELYNEKSDGLCGNEDCGQMSAWYVMSAMGFYPVCPGNKDYAIGTPLFDEMTINLENGNKFTIRANAPSKVNYYIQSMKLNGKSYSKYFINHDDIMAGGVLEMELGPNPLEKAISDADIPKTQITDEEPVLMPIIRTENQSFKNSMTVKMENMSEGAEIHFTTDGTEPTEKSKQYVLPFDISRSQTINAISVKNGKKSPVASGTYFKLKDGVSINIKPRCNQQYTAGGPNGLIDQIRGSENFFQSGWQGYQKVDFEAVVDLGSDKTISNIGAGFMQNTGSWIVFPSYVEFYTSTDGKDFKILEKFENKIPIKELANTKQDFISKMKTNARYIKVFAKNSGQLPEWHLGAGGESFIFIDEIFYDEVK